MDKALKFVCELKDCQRGSTATEYALIASIIGAGLIASLISIGGSVNEQFADTATAVEDAS